MRNILISTSILLVLVSCCSVKEIENIDDHFYTDLASENNRIAGGLYLDVFNESLDSLTYDFYIAYLDSNEMPSAKGLTKTVRKADQHYFKTSKFAFIILLRYNSAGKIVGDNSSTAFIDTVINLNQNGTIPNLEEIAGKMKFK